MANDPQMVRIRQRFERPQVGPIPAAVSRALDPLNLPSRIKPGQTVALTAGSRGIDQIPVILRSVADYLKQLGARPWIVPAMGSHGGATAEGQKHLLESYGITEAALGIPIHTAMEVISLGTTAEGYPVYLDRIASQADHIAVIGRIKPHTSFHGKVESGLLKMMMIGLGKHVGALAYHRILLEQPYDSVVRSVARVHLAKAPIAFGLGIVENAYDEVALLEGIAPQQFEEREEQLLLAARKMLPQLPLRQADLLIVDEIGKNISGSGMDTNVVGRKRAFRLQGSSGDQPQMRLIFVRDLSSRTHGNACGIGLADFTTQRLVNATNYKATVINSLTAGYPEAAFIPVHFETDREVLEAALAITGTRAPHEARVMHIHNTLHLEVLDVSEACLAQIHPETPIEILGSPAPLSFDSAGNLAAIVH